jgi:hypothetical protein
LDTTEHDVDAGVGENGVEQLGELAVAVPPGSGTAPGTRCLPSP